MVKVLSRILGEIKIGEWRRVTNNEVVDRYNNPSITIITMRQRACL